MKEEKIIFSNTQGNRLVGYLFRGSSTSIIIGCHGTHSYNAFPQAKTLFAYYQSLGFSTFRFDFSGYGESEGKISLLQRVDDIGSAITAVGTGYKELIISAISLGALPSAIAVTKYKQITKFIVTNGLFNFREINFMLRMWVNMYLLFHKTARKEKKILEQMFYPEKISIPTLVLCCEKDTIVYPKQSKDFFAQLHTEKKIVSIPDANHYAVLEKDVSKKMNEIIKNWLAEYRLP